MKKILLLLLVLLFTFQTKAAVNAPYAPVSYACDGSTAAFSVNFPYLAQTDLAVTSTTAGGAVTALVLGTDYSLSVVSTTSTATLTVNSPSTKCPSGSTLKIARNMSITQPTGFRGQTNYDPSLHELAYDRCVMQEQQIQAQFAGTQNVNFGGLNTWTATQTFSPSASDAIVATGGGTGRGMVASSGATSGVAGQFTTGNAVNAPIRNVPVSTDPSTPADGETWVNSTQKSAKSRIGGATYTYAGNPMLAANTSAGQSIPASGTTVIVVFGTVERDTDSAYNSGTGRYTIPTGKGGDYAVISCVRFSVALPTGVGVGFSIFKNAAQIKAIEQINPGQYQSECVSTIANFVAGDVIDIRVAQNESTAKNLDTSAIFNYFALKRLSD